MRLSALLPLLFLASAEAFAPSVERNVATAAVFWGANTSTGNKANNHDRQLDRRSAILTTAASLTAALAATMNPPAVFAAEDVNTVVVAGATGQTGRRVLERLAATKGLQVIGGVRNVEKAIKSLAESSTVLRDAILQSVASDDTSAVQLRHLDVVMDTVDQMAETLQGADALVIATGSGLGNPLKMKAAAHEVDNVGTCRLIDAAKKAGVKKVVMISSILTNGRAWGQEKSAGFVVINAFGGILDEKHAAEKCVRASGLNYTIVRPGTLKAKPPTGALVISGEDTLVAGEVSRDLVADVLVASLTDPKASNKVLEIVEDGAVSAMVFNGLNM